MHNDFCEEVGIDSFCDWNVAKWRNVIVIEMI